MGGNLQELKNFRGQNLQRVILRVGEYARSRPTEAPPFTQGGCPYPIDAVLCGAVVASLVFIVQRLATHSA